MVPLKPILDLLAEHRFFKNLSGDELGLIQGCGSNAHFKESDFLLRDGEAADQFYIIRKGLVAVQVHAPGRGAITVQTVGEGDVLGWSWLIPPHTWSFDAKALEEVSAIQLDGVCLRGKCEENHGLGYHLLKCFSAMLAERLEATRLQLLDVYGRNPQS